MVCLYYCTILSVEKRAEKNRSFFKNDPDWNFSMIDTPSCKTDLPKKMDEWSEDIDHRDLTEFLTPVPVNFSISKVSELMKVFREK